MHCIFMFLTAWTTARRRALQDSIAACEHGHGARFIDQAGHSSARSVSSYIVQLDTKRAGVSGLDRMSRLEKLIRDATKTTSGAQHGASAPARVTRHLDAISAVAVELGSDARESLLHQPDIASITADCTIRLPPDEVPRTPTLPWKA